MAWSDHGPRDSDTFPMLDAWEPAADGSARGRASAPRSVAASLEFVLVGERDREDPPEGAISRPHGQAGRVRFPAPGATLGGFCLVAVLGRGSFARVYLAEQTELAGRPVALKVSEALGDEPQALARLQHAHIVPIHSVHDDPATGLRLLCMPYLGGANLEQVLETAGATAPAPSLVEGRSLIEALDDLERRSLPASLAERYSALRSGWSRVGATRRPRAVTAQPASPTLVRSRFAHYLRRFARGQGGPPAAPLGASALEEQAPARSFYRAHNFVQAAVWIAARLAEALEHAHARGILHRDLKPSNVLIAADGTPMLLDFNLSAQVGPDGAARAAVGGTLPYMAPEHLDAFNPQGKAPPEAVDERSDLYALGLILYEMLAGRHPFADPDPHLPLPEALEQMIAERRRGAPPIRAVNPLVPPSLAALLRKCLEPDPDRRHRNAAELAEDLRRFLDDRPMKYAPEPSLRERAAKWLRRHPEARSASTIGALAAALLVGLGLIGWTVADQLEGAWAVLRRNEFSDRFRQCQLLLNTTNGPRNHLARGLDIARKALAAYDLDRNADASAGALPAGWFGRPAVRRLPADEQRRLREELAELLLLRARGRLALTERAPPAARRAALAESLAWLDRAEAIDPRPPAALYRQRALVGRSLGLAQRAQTDAARAAQAGLVDARDYYLDGTSQAAAGRADRAEPLLARAVALEPRRFWARFALGLCHLDQGRYAEAAADFDACTLLTPNFAWPYVNRGVALAAEGRLVEARIAYDRALEVDPKLAEARVNRALVCLALDQPAQAADDLLAAINARRRGPAVLAARAEALARLGRHAEAARELDDLLAKDPNDVVALVARGVFRLQQGDRDGAGADLSKAVRLDPDNARARLGLAHLKRATDPAAALAEIERALQADPRLLDAVQLRALLRARLGDPSVLGDVDRLAAAPTPLNLYNAACALGVFAQTSGDDRVLPRAAALLRRALDAGFPRDQARDDRDLAPLRDHPDARDLFNPPSPAPNR